MSSLTHTQPAASAPGDRSWLDDFSRHEVRARRADAAIIWFERIGLAVLALGVWQILVDTKVLSQHTVGEPTGVLSYFFGTLIQQSSFWHDVAITSEETFFGLFFGVVAGAVVGVACGLSARLSRALQPLIVGINAIPKVALAPLVVVWLGLGVNSKIALAALGSFFVIFFNVVGGLNQQDQSLILNARMLGMSRIGIVRAVRLPSIGVWVVTALKLAISLAVVGAVVGEYIGASAGLGYEVNTAVNSVQVTRMMALLIAVAGLGCVAYSVVGVFERIILRWR
jgi:NitT/TauT family transport system permease protein